MSKSAFLVFTFILIFQISLKAHASEPRLLQGGGNSGSGGGGSGSGSGSNTGYGSTPVYEEYYEEPPKYEEKEEEREEEVYEETPPYGGGGGYGSTPVYEEYYEQPEEEREEERYEEEYEEEQYEEEVEEEYEEEEEEYVPPPVYGGGYGSTPIYEEYYNEQPEYEVSTPETYYEETGIYYPEETYAPGTQPPKAPKWPPSYKTGYVVDIHFLSGDPHFQYIAYHYCQELYTGFSQCDIYNGTKKNSKFMATEFVVSREIFETLPMEERKFWHSHEFAVKNGILVLPGLSEEAELEALKGVVNTYGKVTDFWHSYQSFPYGGAKLAYGLGDESQIIPEVVQQMDQELGLSTTWQERTRARRNIEALPKVEGADGYLTTGEYPQYVVKMFDVQTIGVAEEESQGQEGAAEEVEEEEQDVVVDESAPEEDVEEEEVDVIIEEFVFEESRRM